MVFNFVGSSRNKFSALKLVDFLLKVGNEFTQGEIELLAALKNSIRRSDFTVCLNLNFDLLLEWMRLLVTSKSDSRVLEQLISEAVAECMILILNDHSSLKPLS